MSTHENSFFVSICRVHAICSEITGGNNGGHDMRVPSCSCLQTDVIQCVSGVVRKKKKDVAQGQERGGVRGL